MSPGPHPRPAVPGRPAHLRPALVGLVAFGGAVGSAARHGAQVAVGTVDDLPLGTLVVNLVGAFALGLLLELSAGPDDPGHHRRRNLRLFLGTGFLGGFTTYSAFALETERLLAAGDQGVALSYLLATVAGGFAASVLGVAAGRRARRGRGR